jgi:hypothetical protein
VSEQQTTAAPRIAKPYQRLTGDERQRFRDYVATQYRSGRSIRAVAADVGASFGRTRTALLASGVTLRPRNFHRPGGGR